MTNEPLFKQGARVKYSVDGLIYTVEHVTEVGGTPNERFYIIKLAGRYRWLWQFTESPAITHTLPEGYAKKTLTLL